MQQVRRVVVGFDGTDPSGRAVDWASDEAVRRGLPLTVLSASEPVDVVPRHSEGSAWMPVDALPVARALAAAGEARARARHPHVVLHVRPTVGRPADALVVASWSGALVVVGTRGHGEVAGDLLGSVATALVTRGQGQVVVVRGGGHTLPGPDHPVVVGVDGTPGGALAADAAARFAAETGAELVVVTAFLVPARETYALATVGPAPDLLPDGAAEQRAARVLRKTATRLAHDWPQLSVRTVCREGTAAKVLTGAAPTAGLLVVGSRGRGSLASVLLGSVGRRVSHVALCPVLVVHPGVSDSAGTVGSPAS